jgi:hypothetical protein
MAIVTTHQIQIDFDNEDGISDEEFAVFDAEVRDICTVFNHLDVHALFKGNVDNTPNVYIDCRTLEIAQDIQKKVIELIMSKSWTVG